MTSLPNDERYTLKPTLEQLQKFARLEGRDFDLDPCASARGGAKAETNFLEGLNRDWFGHVYVNPPFSQLMTWVEKCIEEVPRVKSITLLVPANRTEQAWWQRLWGYLVATGSTHEILWLTPRVRFGTPDDLNGTRKDNKPPFACVAVRLKGGVQ